MSTTNFQIKADVVNGNQILRVRGYNRDGSSWEMATGDLVETHDDPESDDYDKGRISYFFDINTAVVYWESGVETKIEIARISHVEGE